MKQKNSTGKLVPALAWAAAALVLSWAAGVLPPHDPGSLLGLLAILLLGAAGFFLTARNRKKPDSQAQTGTSMADRKSLESVEDEIRRTSPGPFKKQMRQLEAQTDRMMEKLKSLDRVIGDYFGQSRISYSKFMASVNAVCSVFEENAGKILKRISIFDRKGYEDLYARHQENTDAAKPYQASFDYVDEKLQENERILSRLDQLLLEVNQLSDSAVPIEELPAMQELSELIGQTKLYQQNQNH